MSYRDWYDRNAALIVVILSFVVVIPSVWWLASEAAYETAYEHYAAGNAKRQAERELGRNCSGLPTRTEIIDCLKEHIHTTRESERAEEDLRAQKEMANWALGILVTTSAVGFITIIITGLGVFYVARTLEQTRIGTKAAAEAAAKADEANRIMRDGIIAEQRPWVSVKAVKVDQGILSKDAIAITLRVKYENIGKTPAMNVRTNCRTYLRGVGSNKSPFENGFSG